MKEIKWIVLTFLLITVAPALLWVDIHSSARTSNFQILQGGSTEVHGVIAVNTTWTLGGSPYVVVSDVTVLSMACLTIEPGVTVKFAAGTNLIISGSLFARGNATYNITFTSNSTTPTPGIWGSVWSSGNVFVMDFSVINYADRGLELIVPTNISNSTISNCNVGVEGKLNNAYNLTVTNDSGDGLSVSSSLVIKNSSISNNGGHGITITGGSIDMNGCAVLNNVEEGVILPNGGTINNSIISGNGGNGTCILGPTTVVNTVISGNGGNGIWTGANMLIGQCNISGNEENGIIGGYTGGSITVHNSNISCNSGDGICTNSSLEINGCGINNNTGNGLSGCGHVSYSNVSGNDACGILGNFNVESYCNVTWNLGGGFNGTGRIYWCSIYNNSPYDAIAGILPNNITAAQNWWGTNESASIRQHIWDNANDSRLGFVDFSNWLPSFPQPIDLISPTIQPPVWMGTSPPPYVPWTLFEYYPKVRQNEPVYVSVNVTDDSSPIPSGVDRVLLSYRVNSSEWWNTTMTLTIMYTQLGGNWMTVIPGQLGNSTVEFFIQAYDKAGNLATSSTYSYKVERLPIGDVNGDSTTNMADIQMLINHFLKSDP